MGTSAVFDLPVTVEECRLAGRKFGGSWAAQPAALDQATLRIAFEKAQVIQLHALEDAFSGKNMDTQEVLAAFDQAAWSGLGAGQLVQIPDYATAAGHQQGGQTPE